MLAFFSIALTLSAVVSLLYYQLRTGVPPMSASDREAAEVVALLKKAHLPAQAVIYDLGSGWGKLALVLARSFPDARIIGIELSPLPFAIARLRTRNFRNVTFRREDFRTANFSDADAVTCYLMMNPMSALGRCLDSQIKPGTPVVTLTFWFRGRTPAATGAAAIQGGQPALYLWPALSPNL